MSRPYKNLTQRARRYARGKLPGYDDSGQYKRMTVQAFRDGYKLAMKEIRGIILARMNNTYEAWRDINAHANDSERLK